MSDPDPSGNKTVFRPSPLQALKSGGSPVVPTAPPPPPPAVAPSPRAAAPAVRAANGGWRRALVIVFVVVSVLAIGYVVLQLTGRRSGYSPAVWTSVLQRGPVVPDAPKAVV